MGIVTKTDAENNKAVYVYIATKKEQQMGLYMKPKDQDKVFISSISGQIVDIKKVLKKPKQGQKWTAYFSYQFTFFDPSSDPNNIILDIAQQNFHTPSILNSLLSIEHPGTIELSAFTKTNGYLGIFFKNNKKEVSWKYQWDSKTNSFETIPPVERTFLRNDPAGNPIYDRNSQARDARLDEIIAELYTTFTGKQWSAVQIHGDNPANPTLHTKKESPSKKILTGVRQHLATPAEFLMHWNPTPKGLPARMKREIGEKVELGNCMMQLQSHLNTMAASNGVKYILDLNGSYTQQDLPLKDDVINCDDLPF